MNTNRIKSIKFFTLILFTFLLMPSIVFAKCSDNFESQCNSAVEDGYKCEYEWHTNSGICKKTEECASGYTKKNGVCARVEVTNPASSSSSASANTSISCSTIPSQKDCNANAKCRWISGSCQEQYVAQDPCNEVDIKRVLKIFGIILMIAKLVVPLLIIGFGTIDLYKSAIDKDEKSLIKQGKILTIRILTGIFIFFIPTLVNVIFKMITDITENDQYKICVSCVLDPTNEAECDTTVSTAGRSCASYTDQESCRQNNYCSWSSDNVCSETPIATCQAGKIRGKDGLCYDEGTCGSKLDSTSCNSMEGCKWSARNGCQSK